jgi:hypothetical protein
MLHVVSRVKTEGYATCSTINASPEAVDLVLG